MALPIAFLGVRYASAVTRWLEGAAYVAGSLPGIVIALAFASVTIRLLPKLYQTAPVLILAYALLFLPRALVSLRTGIAQAPPVFEEVARSLGHSPFRTFRLVTARLIRPAAAAGGALVFLGVVNELTATLLLGPIGTQTLATSFWTHVTDLDYARAAPYAVLMITLSMPMVWLLARGDARPTARG
jgi:iron(III) transport system permease protein